MKKKVLVIVGPTAVGKTALGVTLANQYGGEVISGDSLQVYRSLDIGTAKVTKEESQGVPHHLIDIKEPTEAYSAHEFKISAQTLIDEFHERNVLPIIVGGTGLYIQSLLFDFTLGVKQEALETGPVREKWELFAREWGKERLWQALYEIDPLAANNIHQNNQKRVIRALEVYESTGESLLKESPVDFRDLNQSQYDVKLIGLTTDRGILYNRINQRVDLMLEEGLLEEARSVHSLGKCQSSQGIGYKEFFPYFEGNVSLDVAIEDVKQQSRRYAKRQLTWFKNRMTVEWWDLVQEPNHIEQLLASVKSWHSDRKEGE